jgi:hypothetical protein
MNRSQSLAQNLAVQTQVNLPGTAGRLLKQIRDLEAVAPFFMEAGLIRSVQRPFPLNACLSGVSTMYRVTPALGGYLYISAAVRVDLKVEQNAVSTQSEDSVSVIDDIGFEEQIKRLQLIEIDQSYELAGRTLESETRPDLLLLEGPLVLNRSLVPLRENAAHQAAFDATCARISAFWRNFRDRLYPWNPQGVVVAGIATERLGAIAAISQQDLRTPEGRSQLLNMDAKMLATLNDRLGKGTAIGTIGEKRFMQAVLGNHARTAAFRMNAQTPRMEPFDLVREAGVVGFHFRAGPGTEPRLVEVLGNDEGWNDEALDRLAGMLMAATVLRGRHSLPLPLQLAKQQHQALPPFLQQYKNGLLSELKERNVEDAWLSDLSGDGGEMSLGN